MKLRFKLLLAAAVLQAVLLVYVLWYFTVFQDEAKTDLEYTACENGDKYYVSDSELLNNVSLLSGSEILGMEEERYSFAAPAPGNMMWFIAKKDVKSKECFISKWPKDNSFNIPSRLSAGFQDGVINFVYDFGNDASISGANWVNTAVRKLNASSLLSWQKNLDAVFVSYLSEDFNNGLNYFYPDHEDVILICPEFNLKKLDKYIRIGDKCTPKIVMAPKGINEAVPGIWTCVTEIEGAAAGEPQFELDLINLSSSGELQLFVGAGKVSFEKLLESVKSEFKRYPDLAVVNFSREYKFEDDSLYKKIDSWPMKYGNMRIIACSDTDLNVLDALNASFGERYEPGKLMKRIKL